MPEQQFVRSLALLFVCLVGALAVLLLLYWGLMRLRRALKGPPSFQSSPGWTLDQIKELHESGRLTDKQYRSLRDAVIRSLDRTEPPGRSRR